MIEDIRIAKEKGFNSEFFFVNGKLRCRGSKVEYTAEDCKLVEYRRYEGMTDPGDSSILFLIKCFDGTKGCLSSAYGKDADTDLIEFVRSLTRE